MKIIKSHGMSSEKASRIKKRGHRKEHIFAGLIKGEVVKGTRKIDVKDSNGKIYSIKGGGEIKGGEGRKGKWQLFLHKLSKFENNTEFLNRYIFIKILKAYPEKYEEYQSNKEVIKNNIVPYMKELKEFLVDSRNKYDFLNKALFDKRIDYFVVYQDDIFYIFDRNEMLIIFTENLLVENSSTFQKVVFKYENKIISEIEVRTTNDGKYPSILFNMLKEKALNLLIKETKKYKKINENIYVYGEAIGSCIL